jgi:hypothetical protein
MDHTTNGEWSKAPHILKTGKFIEVSGKLHTVAALHPKRAVLYLRSLVAGFPTRRPGFEPRSGHVGFVVDKLTRGQVFSEYFGCPCQFSSHRLLHTYHLSSGAGTIGQLVDSSLTPAQQNKKTKLCGFRLQANYMDRATAACRRS